VLGIFLGANLWKPFQLFHRILIYVSNITKAPSLHCWFKLREQVKSTGGRSGECAGCSSVVTVLFATKALIKTDQCAEASSWGRNRLLVLHFSGRFLLTAFLRRRRMSMYISLFTVLHKFPSCSSSCKLWQWIRVNLTSEFQVLSEATAYTIMVPTMHICILKLGYIHKGLLHVSANRVTIFRDVKYKG
jgi:hypothetical protein